MLILKGFVSFGVFHRVPKYSPHDFTVRIRTVRQRRIRVHRIPPRACDDRETPLVPGRDERGILLIWVGGQVNFGKTEIEGGAGRASMSGKPSR